jgi:GNAT superfamily N-acetyltransferase
MESSAAAIRIEPLGPQHDRGAFCCGNPIIDDWCHKQAHKDHDKYRARVFVACDAESNTVQGFYSLTIRSLAPRTFLNIGFGSREIPAIYFAMLGVDKSRAGAGIGSALMIDSFERVLRVAEDVGAYCLWLTSVSEVRVKFYSDRKFMRIEDGKLDMYLPLETIRDAFKN